MSETKNKIGQEINRGDLILAFSTYGPRLLIVRSTKLWVDLENQPELRYSSLLGVEIRGYYYGQWIEHKYVRDPNDYRVDAAKSKVSNLNLILKVDFNDLQKFGIDHRMIQLAHDTIPKVLAGEYEPKSKRKKK